jgi:hypothetical protein
VPRSEKGSLFDHVVGTNEYRSWDGEAKCPSGLEVDRQLELRRLHHRQISGLLTLKDATDIDADLTMRVRKVASVAEQTAGLGEIRGDCS